MHWISAEFWRGRRVLVTGASGFLGSWVAEQLLQTEAEVFSAGGHRRPCHGEHRVTSQLPLDAEALVKWAQPEVVFHLAAPVILEETPDQETTLECGIYRATEAILRACTARGARMVQVGTCAEYGDVEAPYQEHQQARPTSPYGRHKLYASTCVREAGHVVVRPFRAIGPGDRSSVVAASARAALQGNAFEMTSGEQRREWNHASAVAKGIVAAGAHPGAVGRIINVGGGETASVLSVVQQVFALAKADPELIHPGVRPQRVGDVPLLAGDHHAANSLWGPIRQPPLGHTLADAVSWVRSELGEGAQP